MSYTDYSNTLIVYCTTERIQSRYPGFYPWGYAYPRLGTTALGHPLTAAMLRDTMKLRPVYAGTALASGGNEILMQKGETHTKSC
jgi:hypothetical protein